MSLDFLWKKNLARYQFLTLIHELKHVMLLDVTMFILVEKNYMTCLYELCFYFCNAATVNHMKQQRKHCTCIV